MKKRLLIVCLLALSACSSKDIEEEMVSAQVAISEAKAKEITMEIIKEFWQVYEEIRVQSTLEEKHAQFVPFMTEEMFERAFTGTGKPAFPQLPIHTFGVHVTEQTPDSFTIEHIIAAGSEEGAAVKQTTSFIERDGRFVVSDYHTEDTLLSLTKEEVEAFLVERGYEVVFLKEGPFDAFSTIIEEAYIFLDQKDERMQFIINKKTGFFMMGIVWGDKGAEPDTDSDATVEEVRAKYNHLFAYRLVEIEADTLSVEQRDIYDRYIIQPIEQAIDIDFDPSLTDEESNHKTKELLDQSVVGMLAEIERTLGEEEFATLQESRATWEAERRKYAVEMAEASESDRINHFYTAYKEATEDYLAYLFSEYLYE